MKAPTGRGPTDRELRVLEALLKRAGSVHELQRWIKLATPGHRRGRPPESSQYADTDDMALWVAETLWLSGKLSLHKAITLVASWGPLGWQKGRGSSQGAMIKRLEAKARAGRAAFDQQQISPDEEQRCIKAILQMRESDDPGRRLYAGILLSANPLPIKSTRIKRKGIPPKG